MRGNKVWQYFFCFLIVCLCISCLAEKVNIPINLTRKELLGIPEKGPPFSSITSRHYRNYDNEPPDRMYPIQHAGLPQGLAVYPMPLTDSDHELKFNVSWQAGFGPPARDYSLEVSSVTDTVDCQTPMCYEYNIPGDALWWTIPAFSSPVAESCAVRPGCSYLVRLIPHPWDGHTTANLHVELDECVAGVCSCAHSPRLPEPVVQTHIVTIQGEIFANVSWILPRPKFPLRLPPRLNKKAYEVSIGEQMVSNVHLEPWFANTVTRRLDAEGPVALGDGQRWLLLPITEHSDEQSDKRARVVLEARLLGRVSLIDDRGCRGPAGTANVYDPAEASEVSFATYALWAIFGGACVIAMAAIVAAGARGVKRVLNAFRPAPAAAAAPLEPLRRRPAWFPLQLRT